MRYIALKTFYVGVALFVGIVALAIHPALSAVTNSSVAEFSTTGQPEYITIGPDGNLWFTEFNAIGRVTGSGVVTEFPLPAGSSNPHAIAAGPDGNLWFTLPHQNKVGRISPSGDITEVLGITGPMGITAGPDGNLWITQSSDSIAQITTTGIITAFPIAPESYPDAITVGADGNLWYVITVAYKGGNKIGRITTTGVYTEFNVPTWASGISNLTAGKDGSIWFSESWADKIGRITSSGVVTEFKISPIPFTIYPWGLTTGPDGYIWFAGYYPGVLGRVTPAGNVTYFSIPTPDSGPIGITTGPDGNIWFTEYYGQKIGRLTIYRSFLPLVAK
jgi:streptogramin lyase